VVELILHNALYVSKCPVRLLCPRHVAENTGIITDGFNSLKDIGALTIHGEQITVPYNSQTGLPLIRTVPGTKMFQAFTAETLSATDQSMIRGNLINLQWVKRILHERCNHVSFKQLNSWICQGLLQVDSSVANAPDPVCCTCQFGKARKKSHKVDWQYYCISHPGQGISMDQLEAGYQGRIPTTCGLPTTKRYKFINLWVDHYSPYIFLTFHSTKELKELLASKQEFKAVAQRHGVLLTDIKADNGVYDSTGF
jgi:hypothetical protein